MSLYLYFLAGIYVGLQLYADRQWKSSIRMLILKYLEGSLQKGDFRIYFNILELIIDF